MILRQENTHDWLTRTEIEAKEHLRLAETHWIEFCKAVDAIQKSGFWKQKAKTWHEYVRITWNRDSSRIRQFRASLSYAEKILNAFDDLSTPENNIRKMKQAGVTPDNPDMPRIYKTVVEYASENDVPVQTSFFKHAKAVYDEAQTTGGYVDIGEDEIVPVDWENSTKLAMVRSINEANARYKERLNNKKIGIQVKAKRISRNQYWIECENDLPEQFQFKLWLDNS